MFWCVSTDFNFSNFHSFFLYNNFRVNKNGLQDNESALYVDNFYCPGNSLYRKKSGIIRVIKLSKCDKRRNSRQNLTSNKHDYLLVDIWPDIRPDRISGWIPDIWQKIGWISGATLVLSLIFCTYFATLIKILL